VTGPHWQHILTRPVSAGGAAIAELTEARSRRLDFALDDDAKVSWTMPGRHSQTALIDELENDVVVARDGLALFRGRINASDDTGNANVHTCTFSAVDYRGLLSRRIVWPTSTLTFAAVDQSAIAARLINDSQALGTLGITAAPAATGVLRDRTYDVGSTIGDLIASLGRAINGFDWDVSPTLAFRVFYPARGTTTATFVAEYGRNVTDFRRTVASGDFANAIRFSGEQTAPATTRVITPGPEGRWERQVGNPDLITAAAIGEQADGAIAAVSAIRPSYGVTLLPGAWSPGTVWLGDTVRLLIRSGRLDVDTTTRVVGVSIDIGDHGDEKVTLQLGRYRWRFAERLADYQVRLDRLERS
jgi:hypothetical protein